MLFEKLFGLGAALAEGAATAAEGTADAAAQEVNPVVSLLFTFAPLILIFVVFWFMMIRPQRKKDKQVKEMLNNLKAGDRICTIGGIYGTITGIKDDTITLAVGQKGGAPMEMTVARWAIRQVEEVSVENEGEILA